MMAPKSESLIARFLFWSVLVVCIGGGGCVSLADSSDPKKDGETTLPVKTRVWSETSLHNDDFRQVFASSFHLNNRLGIGRQEKFLVDYQVFWRDATGNRTLAFYSRRLGVSLLFQHPADGKSSPVSEDTEKMLLQQAWLVRHPRGVDEIGLKGDCLAVLNGQNQNALFLSGDFELSQGKQGLFKVEVLGDGLSTSDGIPIWGSAVVNEIEYCDRQIKRLLEVQNNNAGNASQSRILEYQERLAQLRGIEQQAAVGSISISSGILKGRWVRKKPLLDFDLP